MSALNKLSYRLILSFALVFVIAISSVVWLAVRPYAERYHQSLEEQSRMTAQHVAASSVAHLLTENIAALEQLLLLNAQLPHLQAIEITNPGFEVIASIANDRQQGVHIVYEDSELHRHEHPLDRTKSEIIYKGDILWVWEPIQLDKTIGWVHLGFSLKEYKVVQQRAMFNTIAVVLLAIIGGLLVLWRVLKRPLAELNEATRFALGMSERHGEQLNLDSETRETRSLIKALNHASSDLYHQKILLDTIREMQTQFIVYGDAHRVFSHLLESLLGFCESDYGFIGEVLHDEKGQPYLRTHAITDIAWNESTRRFYDDNVISGVEFFNLNTLFGEVVLTQQPLFTNSPSSHPKAAGLPPGHPELNAFMGLPIFSGEVMVGMVGLANRKAGYEPAWADYLQPLLLTCGHLIQAFRNDARRLTAEAALRTSERRLSEAQRIAHIGNWESDLLANQDRWSDEMYRITGIAKGEEPSFELFMSQVHPDDRQRVISVNEMANIKKEPYHYECRMKSETESEKVVLIHVNFEDDETGKVVRIYGTVQDVTERKRMERMKDEFVSTVSHELRTPLTSIQGALGLVSGGAAGELPDKAEGLIKIAYDNTQRLLHLINDILDVSKIETGKMEFDFHELDLNQLIKHATEANRAYSPNIHLRNETCCEGIKIRADKERLMQVMSNLISNAVKFSPDKAEVLVRVDCIEDRVRVSVIDQGPGIPEGFQDKVFDRFSQADASSTRHVGGTGLGLSISRAIVEQHQGQIDFVTETGKGTTFFFELPRL